MQNTATITNWNSLLLDNHIVEVKVDVSGEEFLGFDGESGVWELKKEAALFDGEPKVGQCASNKIEIAFITDKTIPRMAEIKVFVRLAKYSRTETLEAASDYLPHGTFYVATREKEDDVIYFTAYDAMLKAEQTYADLTDFDEWPQSEADVADEIAQLIGVEVDPRTDLAGYQVPHPNDLTMREVLGYIAAANAGNWTITDDNKLLLVPICKGVSVLGVDTSTGILFGDDLIVLSSGYNYEDNRSVLAADEETGMLFGDTAVLTSASLIRSSGRNIGKNVQTFANYGKLETFTGVKVWWTDEDAYVAGDDAGRVLELDCPWATQAMANAIFNKIEGYAWQGAAATYAQINPAAELGDIVTCDGVVFPLIQYSVVYDGSFLPDITSPSSDEVDNEYPYMTPTNRELQRRVKLGRSYEGVRITREKGIEVVHVENNGTETSRVVLNSGTLAFYNANGSQALYFDAAAGKYKFVGDVTITSGSLNINNNAIIAPNGDITSYGSVYLLGSDTKISSPTIEGNAINVHGHFGVYNENGRILVGHMGKGRGRDGDGNITEGVVLSYGDPNDLFEDDDYYIICTNAGVRLQAIDTSLAVVDGAAYYDGVEIATLDDTGSIWSEISDIWDAIQALQPSGE